MSLIGDLPTQPISANMEAAGLALQGFAPVRGAGPFDFVPCGHFAQDDNLNSGFVGKY